MTTDNEDRQRWYGVRVGDTVEEEAFGRTVRGVVASLHPWDNNACMIVVAGRERKAVCEWLTVIERVEGE